MTDEVTYDDRLVDVLATIRARGSIGERSLRDAIAHADRFVRALPGGSRRLVDLGSGGGLPGLVIAVRRPDVTVTLVERRVSRADQLKRAVSALSLANTNVLGQDVRLVAAAYPAGFDVVTARSFGPPATTAAWIGRLLRPGGLGLVSEPPLPAADRWSQTILNDAALTDEGRFDGLRRLTKN